MMTEFRCRTCGRHFETEAEARFHFETETGHTVGPAPPVHEGPCHCGETHYPEDFPFGPLIEREALEGLREEVLVFE